MAREIVFVFVVTSLLYFAVAVPEAGIKEMSFNKDLKFHGFHKSLFSGGSIYISGDISNVSKTSPVKVEWTLFFSECAQAYAGLQDTKLRDLPQDFFDIHVVDAGMQLLIDNGPFDLVESVHKKVTVYTFPKTKAQKNASPKNTSPKNISPKNTPPKNTPTKNTPPKNRPPKNRPPKNTSPKNTPQRKRENNALGNKKLRIKKRSSPSHLKDKRIKRAAGNPAKLQKDTSAATNPSQSSTKQLKKVHSSKKDTSAATKPSQSLTKQLKKQVQTTAKSGHVMKGHSQSGRVTTVGKDGNYLLRVKVSRQGASKSEYKVQITVQIKSDKYGFLSAAEWPLLPFYGVMSLVYLAYGVVWLIVSACQWRELLRIQFWIGGVIALGMLEKAVLFSEYNNVNNTGVPAHGLVVFGLVISCIKRTLSRILIIIVSLGFGIVKPRLGAALHRVLAVGLLYFILCVIEGGYREKALKADVENKQLVAAIPLSILDAVICWWIFMSLMQTMRTLRIRKNIVKLSLYRHFTNILVFSVIASVAFMVWSIKSYHLNACIKDWKELWIDEAFWHFLFAIVLLAIMVLWRPTANNQRYAFTPLIDVGEDDDDDMTLSDAFNGMKMRNKSEGDVANRADKHKSKLEDDLRWVEENIPTAGGIDTALPTLLDSDEEVMTTKLEMSKME